MKHFVRQMLLVALLAAASPHCYGQGQEPPYANGFDTKEDFEQFTVIDVAGDGKTWDYSTYYGSEQTAVCGSSKSLPKDDWLISPAIHLTAGKSYSFSFLTYCDLPSYPERVEACCGKAATVDGQTTKLIESTLVDWDKDNSKTLSATFTPDADGDYYFGIHAISDMYMWDLFVDNFGVKEVSHNTPAAVTALTAVTADKGQLPVTISFVAPTVNAKGDALTALTRISVMREGSLIHEFANPQPGQSLSYDDAEAKEGVNHYQVTAENESGEGPVSSVACYVGSDTQPLAVSNLKAVDHGDGTVTLSWDAPVKGVKGGYVDPASVRYRVTRVNGDDYKELGKDLSTTEVVDTLNISGQASVSYTVNDYLDGSPYNYDIANLYTMVGKPYELPFKESGKNGMMEMQPWGEQSFSTMGGWFVLPDDNAGVKAYDGDGGYLAFIPMAESDSAQMASPKIAIKDAIAPTLSFSYYAKKGSTSRLHVGLAADGDLFHEELAVSLDAESDGWQQVELPLDKYTNCDYVRFALTGAAAGSRDTIRVDNIVLTAKKERDLAVGQVMWPDEMSMGYANMVYASVVNKGTQQVGSFSVQLLRDQTVIAEKKFEGLAPSEAADVEFTDNVAGLEAPTAVYQVAVDYADDLEPANNRSAAVELNVNHHWDYPLVKNAKGTLDKGQAQLTWEAPDAYTETTESFEHAADFAIAGISPWVVRDFNGHNTLTVGDGSYANAGQPAAFMVFNPAVAGVRDTAFVPHSGEKLLAAFANTQGANDGWLVSPRLSGQEQKITFFAKSANADFPEYMEVWYSSASRNQTDFTSMADAFSLENPGWQKISVDVPEGTQYFAIRCHSNDCYALLLDDISYQSAAAGAQVVGYNVYRDGKLLNDSPVTDLSFTDGNAPTDKSKYGVSVVYTTGESQQAEVGVSVVNAIAKPHAATETVAIDGNRLTVGAAPADVYNAAGMLVAHIEKGSESSVVLPSGIYIVRMNGKSVKIVIR